VRWERNLWWFALPSFLLLFLVLIYPFAWAIWLSLFDYYLVRPDLAGFVGLENYFRLLENWGGDTLTYRGSMVMLYQSETATGIWQSTGNYYNAPIRDWAFDTLFTNKPPPGTPTLHVPQRVGWWHLE